MISHQSLARKNRKQFNQDSQLAEFWKRKSNTSADDNNDKHRGMKAIKNMHKKFESYESTSSGSSSKKQNNNEEEEISIIGLKSGKISKKTKRKDEEEILFIGEKKKTKKRKNITKEKMSTTEEFDVLPQMATLTQDAKRSAQLAQQMFGPRRSKLKPRSLATNKNFLARTLHSVELDRQEWEERKAAAIKRGKRNMAKMESDGKTNNK